MAALREGRPHAGDQTLDNFRAADVALGGVRGELIGEAEAGRIREGGPADFFLVHGDPLSDPDALWRVWRAAWD